MATTSETDNPVDGNRMAVRKRISDAILAAIALEPVTYGEICSVLESIKALTAPAPCPAE
jgi:hypothetical protein